MEVVSLAMGEGSSPDEHPYLHPKISQLYKEITLFPPIANAL
jgi:hypothetical protein